MRRVLRSLRSFRLVGALIALALAALIAYPLLRVIMGLFWVEGQFTTAPLGAMGSIPGFRKTLANTAVVVTISAVLGVSIGAVLAWLNERTDARMGVATDVLPLVTFVIPTIASTSGWLLLLAPNAGYLNWVLRQVLEPLGYTSAEGPLSAYSWPTLIFVYSLHLVPFAFLVVAAGLRQLDPSLEEQSRMCGASVLATLRRVTMPSLKPSLLGAAFLAVWYSLAVFSIPVVLGEPAGIDMLSVRIVSFLRSSFPPETGAAIGLGVIAMVILGSIWLLQQRVLGRQRFAIVGGKGARISRIELGRWRPLARGLMVGYLFVAVVLPVAALALVSLHGFWTTSLRWENFGFDALGDIFANRRTRDAVQNSALLAITAATVLMVLASTIAWWAPRGRGFIARFTGGITKLPAAVSNVVVALGFILAFGGPPFFLGGTVIILLMVYIAVTMPEASIASEAAVSKVGTELGEASYISGAGPGRTFASVYFPLMLPGIAAGWALVFVRVVADLEASALLASFSNPVIGFQILSLFENGGYNRMAALSLLVAGMSTTVLTVVIVGASRWASRGNRG